MKRKPVANLGLFIAFIFLAGFVLITGLRIIRGVPAASLLTAYNLSQLLVALLFFLSSRAQRLYWIQPAIFLAIAPVSFIASHDNFYGIAFFVLAVLLLFKIGFFNSRRIPKAIGVLLYLYLAQIALAVIVGRPFRLAFTSVFFVTVFLVVLYILYKEEIIVYLKEPRPVLDLKEKKISEAEYLYLIALRNGKIPKEIAADHGVKESTVRNTLSRVYKKLEVKDKSELMALTAVHTLKFGEKVH